MNPGFDKNGISVVDVNAKLPQDLSCCKYRVEIHSYSESNSEVASVIARKLSMIKVKANKLNTVSKKLYPQQQVFYISQDADADKRLEKAFKQDQIVGSWVSKPELIDWSSLYNINAEGFGTIDYNRKVED